MDVARYFFALVGVGFLVGLLFVDLQPGEVLPSRSSPALIGSAVADGPELQPREAEASDRLAGGQRNEVDPPASEAPQSGSAADQPQKADQPASPPQTVTTFPTVSGEDRAIVCHAVLDQALAANWHHASWGFSDSDVGSEATTVFPNYWGAMSFQSHGRPVDVSHCRDLRLHMASSVASTFAIQLQTVGGTPAGETPVTVDQDVEEVVVPLDNFDLIDGKVTRVSILNQAEVEGLELTVLALAFTTN